MEELFLGAMESGAVTAQQCKTSWRTLVRFRLQVPLLQPSLQMGELLPGAIKTIYGGYWAEGENYVSRLL